MFLQFFLNVVQFRLAIGQSDAEQSVSVINLGKLLLNRRQFLQMEAVLAGTATAEAAATTWGDRTLNCVGFSG